MVDEQTSSHLTVIKLFEQVVDLIVSSHKAGDRVGWLLDANHYFGEHKAWLTFTAEFTGNPRCLLELKAFVAPTVQSFDQLRRIMHEISTELCWNFQATAFEIYREASILRFATIGSSHAMTGRMIVSGDHYYELARRNENRLHRRLPSFPFDLDFSDLELQLRSPDEQSVYEVENNWNELKLLIPEIVALIEKIERCVSAGKENFLESETSQDALRFNLDVLSRVTAQVSFLRTDIAEWRRDMLQVAHPATRPWNRDSETIWKTAERHVSKLLPIIEKYRMQHDQGI